MCPQGHFRLMISLCRHNRKSSKPSFCGWLVATVASVGNGLLAGHGMRQMSLLSHSVAEYQNFHHLRRRSSSSPLQFITSGTGWGRNPIRPGLHSAVTNVPSRDFCGGRRRHNTKHNANTATCIQHAERTGLPAWPRGHFTG